MSPARTTEFRQWLKNTDNRSNKQTTDYVSRIRRIEIALSKAQGYEFDIENEYNKDKCSFLSKALKHRGLNEEIKSYGDVQLPFGSITMLSLAVALRKYLLFRASLQSNR